MMEFFYLEVMSIPAMLFLWFCRKVTFFKFFCLSDIGKDHNGQMRIKLNNMKFIIIINYQKDTMVNQIISQIINSRFSIWLLFFIQPAENLGLKSFLGQWLLLSLVHQIWVSFKMKVCCLLYDSSKIFTNTTFFIGTDYGTKDATKQIAVILLIEKHFQFSKIFKMLFCKLVIKINSQPQHRHDCKMLVMKCTSNTIAGFKCFRS